MIYLVLNQYLLPVSSSSSNSQESQSEQVFESETQKKLLAQLQYEF